MREEAAAKRGGGEGFNHAAAKTHPILDLLPGDASRTHPHGKVIPRVTLWALARVSTLPAFTLDADGTAFRLENCGQTGFSTERTHVSKLRAPSYSLAFLPARASSFG